MAGQGVPDGALAKAVLRADPDLSVSLLGSVLTDLFRTVGSRL